MTLTTSSPPVRRALREIRKRQLARLIERGQPAIVPDERAAQSFRALARRHGVKTSSSRRPDGRYRVIVDGGYA